MSANESIMLHEIWKPVPIPPFEERYSASTLGRIRCDITITAQYKAGRIIGDSNAEDYKAVTLSLPGQVSKRISVHVVAALTFLGPPPGPIGKRPGEYQVDHLDGQKHNNCPDNLEWVTNQENMQRASRNGQLAHGERNGHAKLTAQDVQDIRRLVSQGHKRYRLAERYNVDKSTIGRLVAARTWQHTDK